MSWSKPETNKAAPSMLELMGCSSLGIVNVAQGIPLPLTHDSQSRGPERTKQCERNANEAEDNPAESERMRVSLVGPGPLKTDRSLTGQL